MAYRIIFAGTPVFSVAPLQALLDEGHEIIAVYTQPDRPAGRGRKLTASPVKQLALQHGLPVFQPESLKTAEAQAELAKHNADIMVVVAYGLILPQAILDTPKLGCLNIHASLLPRWRGAAPIQRAIEAGDKETGITIMQMDAGLDTGAMLLKTHCPILPHDTAETLHDKLATQGAQAIIDALKQLKQLVAEKQDNNQACYAAKLTKAEAKIDWNTSAEVIQRRIHAFNPWPMAFCEFEGQSLRILNAQALEGPAHNNAGEIILLEKAGLDIACGQGLLRITQVQPAGKKPMSAYDFALSRNLIGQVLQ
ncbi:methionyl-tRNA formyltransferase [Thiomicrospira microaerophila]|uniref:methionyl-tRNA formyltransferase n=1 Tax=Thiomicrospira microaerophila TaxID=406020 RepID=UPI00200F9E2E|nr:methionyl-tRNA formyltransferase [Thiomicrospira microaerophila]UQB42047.1 methionyl-tRNA formyltransferase [Thiomicrospira microaerophila]